MTVLIAGGGTGGLICGAILAREGYRVCVLEKHTTAGGGLHTFRRNGLEFDTGMHVVCGFQQDGTLNRLFSWLGIMDVLRIEPAEPLGFDHFHVLQDGATYCMAAGRDNFTATLGQYFPEERDNIRRYMDRVYEICDGIPMFNLRMPDLKTDYGTGTAAAMSVNELIAMYTDNPKLQAVLAWNNALYGGEKDRTPAYIGAFITKAYVEGASRFAGGSQQLADALVDVIRQNGGEVICGNGVRFVDIDNRHVRSVTADDGREFTADVYISAMHTSSLFSLMDHSKIQKSYRRRIDSIPNSYSSFTVYITFKPKSFPYIRHTGYCVSDYDAVWGCADYTRDNWPLGFMYITPSATGNDVYAEKMTVTGIMTFDSVRRWENTVTGRRGDDYRLFKRFCEERLLCALEKIFPDFRPCVERVFSSSPLTIRDYYGTREGANYGTVRDCRNMAASFVSVRTKIDNLLLTGQNINLHGILGVSLTALSTCGELLGVESLLDKINGKE